jgi:hypothetical protein
MQQAIHRRNEPGHSTSHRPRPRVRRAGTRAVGAALRALALGVEMTGRRVACLLALAVTLLAGSATAHPDLPLLNERVRLEPEGSLVVRTALHYHRLVARYHMAEPSDGVVALRVVRGDDVSSASATPFEPDPADVLLDEALTGSGVVNRLVPCCLDVAWQSVVVELRNDGTVPVTLDLRLWAVHDEFAVVSLRAEDGAATIPLALFGLLGGAGLVAGRRREGGQGPASRPWGRIASTLFVTAGVAALALAVTGMARYGGGPSDGLVAIVADLPVPGSVFGSRAATVMSVLMVAWLGAIGAWFAAARHHESGDGPGLAVLGAALATVTLASAAVMSVSYGGSWVPVAQGLVLAVPVAWRAARL